MITPNLSSSPLSLPPISLPSVHAPATAAAAPTETSFSQLLGDVVNEANTQQVKADAAVKGMINGEVDIHQVMISMEQARLSLMTVVEMRNKLLEGYQEISRMQM